MNILGLPQKQTKENIELLNVLLSNSHICQLEFAYLNKKIYICPSKK